MRGRRRWFVLAAVMGVAVGLVIVAVSRAGDDGDDRFCEAFGALLVGPLADPETDAADPEALEAAVTDTLALVGELVDAAPTEQAAAAAEALAAEYEAAFEVVAAYDYDLERVTAEATPEQQAVLDAFGDSSTTGADDPVEDLERVVAERCAPDVSLTTP